MSVDIEKLQTDIEGKLESEAYYTTLPIHSERRLQIANAVDEKVIYQTVKAGKSGAGIVIRMPEISVPFPNVGGPEWIISAGLLVLEHPTLNLDATFGTGKSAEQIAVNILGTLHQWGIEGLGTLYGSPQAVRPNTDFPGLIGYDIKLFCAIPQSVTAQCQIPTISEGGLIITLTNVTSGATIYKTTDGSFPGSGNSAASTATSGVGFAVGDGSTVRWAAYKSGLLGSDVGQVVAVN